MEANFEPIEKLQEEFELIKQEEYDLIKNKYAAADKLRNAVFEQLEQLEQNSWK